MTITYKIENRGLYFSDHQGQKHLGHHLRIEEKLSTPFLIEGILISDRFNAKEQLGQLLICHWNEIVDEKQKEKRVFNGYLTEIQMLEQQGNDNYQQFKITLRPWLWLLSLRTNCQIFQQQSLAQILSSLFNAAGFSAAYNLNSLPSEERTYCVQYNESDFDFVQRLLAEQGIHYYFTHNDKNHTLNFHDPNLPYPQADVEQLEHKTNRSSKNKLITQWQPRIKTHAIAITASNYDYTKSTIVSGEQTDSNHQIANSSKLTQQEYGSYSLTGDASDLPDKVSKIRLQQLQSEHNLIIAESQVEELAIATQFSLVAHSDKAQLGDYIITSITHIIDAAEQAIKYHNQFTCRAKDKINLPAYIAKPTISGLQSAVVIGPENEPSHDEYGRIKVQFHWDKIGGDSPSCWIRVVQLMASSAFGLQFIPRAGDEVLISFVNNDIDHPIVIGSVYNNNNQPVYNEKNSSKSGIRTQINNLSNEICFDDKPDTERLYFHAAKDHLIDVENDFTQTVKANYSSTTKASITINGEDNYTLTIKESLKEKAKNISIKADEKIALSVGNNSITITTEGIDINAEKLTFTAKNKFELKGNNITINSVQDTTITARNNFSASANAQGSLSAKAGVNISTPAQVSISGDAGAELKSSAMTTLSSDGIAKISGTLVQIN